MRTLIAFVAVAGMLATATLVAAEDRAGDITITKAWARSTPPMAKNGAGYVTLHNAGAADRLVGAHSPQADKVQLHTHIQDGEVMRMRRVEAVELPTDATVEFKPGGYHLMFMGLTGPFEMGAFVPVTLEFEQSRAVEITLMVHAKAPTGEMEQEHEGMQHGDHGSME